VPPAPFRELVVGGGCLVDVQFLILVLCL
jgi:hypothetical protein